MKGDDDKKKRKKKKKDKKKKKNGEGESSEEEEEEETRPTQNYVISRAVEMPEGATLSDGDDDQNLDENDPHRALGDIIFDDYKIPDHDDQVTFQLTVIELPFTIAYYCSDLFKLVTSFFSSIWF